MSLLIVGAGGLGRETYDVALALGRDVAGFVDDSRVGEVVRGLPVRSPGEVPAGHEYVLGIADPVARARLSALLDGQGLTPASLVHPRAVVAPGSETGAGALVMANAHVSSDVRLGAHTQVQYNATVGHDSVLEDFATVYPGANVSGSVRLGQGVTVGSNAVVLQGRVVEAGAFVGAGAVVTRDVAAGVTVVGNPARPMRSAGDR